MNKGQRSSKFKSSVPISKTIYRVCVTNICGLIMFYQIPTCLTTRFKVLLEQFTVIQLVKNSLHLWDLKDYCRVHQSPPLDPLYLDLTKPIYIFSS
jgi:hypothetical protein